MPVWAEGTGGDIEGSGNALVNPSLRRRRHRRRPDSFQTGGRIPPSAATGWRWRTFPVAFAFALGVFMMSWLAFVPGLNVVLFIVSMVAVALGMAHILARQVLGRSRGG